MLVYGHDQVKVVSGGLKALTSAGLTVTTAVPAVTPQSSRLQRRTPV